MRYGVAQLVKEAIRRCLGRGGRTRPIRKASPSVRLMLERLEDRTVPSSVSGLSITSGPAAGGTVLQVNGSGFTGATAVSFGGTAAPSFTVLSDTAISVTDPSHAAGTVDVIVTAPSGTSSAAYYDLFTYNAPPPPPPAVTGLSATTGPTTGGGGTVDIFGSGFTGANVVSFGGAGVSYYSFTVVNDGEIALTPPPANAAGKVDVTVTTEYGTSADVMADKYTYVAPPTPPPPAVTGLSITSGPTAGGGGTVDVFGSGFTGANVVSFGGAEVSYYSFTVVNDGEIALTPPPATAAGKVDVTVTTDDGTSALSLEDKYTYVAPPPPAVTAVSPPSGSTAGGAYVEIDGSGFTGADGVSFGSVASYLFSLVNDNVIDAYAPAQAAGTVDVTVNTANGTSAASAADRFTYLAPTTTTLASSANPSTFGQPITLTATVSGGGQGTPTGQVTFEDGTTVLGTAALSPGLIGSKRASPFRPWPPATI